MSEKNRLIIKYLLLLLATFFVCYPLLWMLTMAFKPYPEWTTVSGLTWFPQNPTLQNFEFLLYGEAEGLVVSLDKTVGGALVSSLVTATLGTLIAVVCGTLASYGVVRF